MLRVTLFTLALCAAVLAAPSVKLERKCQPKQISGTVVSRVGQIMSDGSTQTFSARGLFYLDSDRQREVIKQNVAGQGFNINMTYIKDSASNMIYIVLNGKCMKEANSLGPVKNFCNDDADLIYSGSLKIGPHMLDIYNYQYSNGGEMTYTFERDSFTLINAVENQILFNNKQLVAAQFGNYTTDPIPDSIWKIPDICNQ